MPARVFKHKKRPRVKKSVRNTAQARLELISRLGRPVSDFRFSRREGRGWVAEHYHLPTCGLLEPPLLLKCEKKFDLSTAGFIPSDMRKASFICVSIWVTSMVPQRRLVSGVRLFSRAIIFSFTAPSIVFGMKRFFANKLLLGYAFDTQQKIVGGS